MTLSSKQTAIDLKNIKDLGFKIVDLLPEDLSFGLEMNKVYLHSLEEVLLEGFGIRQSFEVRKTWFGLRRKVVPVFKVCVFVQKKFYSTNWNMSSVMDLEEFVLGLHSSYDFEKKVEDAVKKVQEKEKTTGS